MSTEETTALEARKLVEPIRAGRYSYTSDGYLVNTKTGQAIRISRETMVEIRRLREFVEGWLEDIMMHEHERKEG